MSYCRFSDDSDVYMFDYNGVIDCQLCSLGGGGFVEYKDGVSHLMAHRAAGDKVPQYAIDAVAEAAKDE